MPTIDIVAVSAVALLITWLPGLAVTLAARIGWLLSIAVAPAVTYAVVYLGVESAKLLGVDWSIWWLLLVTVLLAALVWISVGRRPSAGDAAVLRSSPRGGWTFALVLAAVAAGIGCAVYLAASHAFDAVPQDYDHVFLANAIRYIAESGDGTAAGLAGVNNYDSTEPSYYPSSFHAIAALTFELSGSNVVAVIHAHVMTWFFMLPLGAMVLARAIGCGFIGMGAAALVSTSFTGLPYELIMRGLVPFGASITSAAAVLALMIIGLRRRRLADAIILVLGAFGLTAAHTSAAVTLIVLGVPALLASLVGQRKHWKSMLGWIGVAAALLIVVIAPTALGMLSMFGGAGNSYDWPAILETGDAVRAGLLFGGGYRETVQLVLAIVVWLGVAATVQRRYRMGLPLALGMAVAMWLFVLAVSSDSPLAQSLTQWWWNDHLRLSALPPIVAPVFVGVLADTVTRIALMGARRAGLLERVDAAVSPRGGSSGARSQWVPVLAALGGATVVAALYLWVTDRGYYDRNVLISGEYYNPETASAVTPNEEEGYEALAEIVPDGVWVMNDFRDGSPWMYAMAGVRPVYGHLSVPPSSPERVALDYRFDEIADDPEIQEIVDERDIGYVWISEGFVWPGWTRSPGMDEIDSQPDVFELVYENPGVQIYEITQEYTGVE